MKNDTYFSENISIDQQELKGFSRSIAELEWLLIILVLLYFFTPAMVAESQPQVVVGMIFYTAFFMTFRYANYFRQETRWKLALETWAMIAFITLVLWYTGKIFSPLLNLYLLVIITAALTLGKLITLLEFALIAACYLYMGYPVYADRLYSLATFSDLMAKFTPFLLVAYLTTMLSSDLHYAKRMFQRLSETDEMTGLLNRRGFKAVLERNARISERYLRSYSVLMIDADNLKQVNDKFGHESGDRLIKMVCNTIKDCMRAADVLARYGGDEFIALLPETNCEQSKEIGERARVAVAKASLSIQHERVSCTVSIGIASFPEDGENAQALLDKADNALYQSKSHGGNRVTLSSEI
ncbi:MAG: hypothetical protein A2W28_08605 [Gammaproteobacteria bacterium RBG_16_51_14]|nr:MAG: hypothetical protein A2W28_08605 [Gammaproteobacteria bacterium RBG_16_51_14]